MLRQSLKRVYPELAGKPRRRPFTLGYSSSTRRGSFLCFSRRSSRRRLSSNFFDGKIGARGRGRNLSFSIVILSGFFFGTASDYTRRDSKMQRDVIRRDGQRVSAESSPSSASSASSAVKMHPE